MMKYRRRNHRPALGAALTAAATALVLAIPSPAAASPAEGNVRGQGGPGALPGKYIVVLRDSHAGSGAVRNAASKLTRRYGGAVRQSFSTALRGFSAKMTVRQAKRLAASPDVAFVEQDRELRIVDRQANPPSWGLDRADQRSLPLNRTYNYPSAGATVHAYVLDTGIRISHSQFAGRASYGYDFIDKDGVANDCNGHGTHVAGTIGGTTYGMAKQVKLVAVRVLNCSGSGSYSQIIAGVDWVTRNAIKPAVANMSLGGGPSSALDAAIASSIAAGITYVVAAGNSNAKACSYSPARIPAAITVGATDSVDNRASFSNYGNCLDLFAPGVSIASAYYKSDTAAARMSGTSMASPHVAGAAALVLAANPAYSPQRVRDFLVTAATSGRVKRPGARSPNRLLYTGTIGSGTPPGATPAPDPSDPPSQDRPSRCAPASNKTPVRIPDLGTARSKIKFANCAGAASVTGRASVKITHPYRGDLRITLIAPDGTGYLLKREYLFDSGRNVVETYSANLSAESRGGVWTLRVDDRYPRDRGTLHNWTLTL